MSALPHTAKMQVVFSWPPTSADGAVGATLSFPLVQSVVLSVTVSVLRSYSFRQSQPGSLTTLGGERVSGVAHLIAISKGRGGGTFQQAGLDWRWRGGRGGLSTTLCFAVSYIPPSDISGNSVYG